MNGICLGLDLTSLAERPTAYAVLDGDRLADIGFAQSDGDIFALADTARPNLIGIDAPLGLPKGLGCLEEPCACGRCQPGPARIRACELELRRKLGVGCFYTTKRSIIKGMVYRGIALKQRFEASGFAVLEVYPFATRVRLWGKPLYRKHTRAGRGWTHQRLLEIILGLPSPPLGHHEADAVLAAYTCYLQSLGQAELLGEQDDGQICVPLVDAGVH